MDSSITSYGQLATTIEDIATAAGVARPTVFSAVGSKPAILKAVIDRAMAGDEAPVAVADRPWYHEAIGEPDPERAITLHARNVTQEGWSAERFEAWLADLLHRVCIA